MEKILKALKEAENAAEKFDQETEAKAASIISTAEQGAKSMELENEAKAKGAGEKLKAARLEEARRKSGEIREESKKQESAISERAKGNLQGCIDEVTEAVVGQMKKFT